MGFDNIEITEFWSWFIKNQHHLKKEKIDRLIIDELEKLLFSFCQLDWEIGPESPGYVFFAVSSLGDPSLSEKAKLLISKAPEIEGWVFLSSKPAKEWNLKFSVEHNGENLQIDGTEWSFVAFKFPDGVFEVDLRPPPRLDLPPKFLENLAHTLLDGELGEATKQRLIEKVSIVKAWSPELKPKSRMIEVGLLKSLIK